MIRNVSHDAAAADSFRVDFLWRNHRPVLPAWTHRNDCCGEIASRTAHGNRLVPTREAVTELLLHHILFLRFRLRVDLTFVSFGQLLNVVLQTRVQVFAEDFVLEKLVSVLVSIAADVAD